MRTTQWPMKPLSGQIVTADVPGEAWRVEFFDPASGDPLGESRLVVRDPHVQIILPKLQGSIAFRLKRQAPTEMIVNCRIRA